MRITRIIGAAVLLFALGGCEPADRPQDQEATTLWDRLTLGVDTYAYAGGTVTITGRYTAGDVDRTGVAVIPVENAVGRVQIDPDGQMWLETLELELADVVVTPNTVPIHLTGLRVTLVEPVIDWPRVTGYDLGQIEMEGPTMVELEWAMVGDNGVIAPLAAQRLGPLAVEVDVRRDANGHVIGEMRLARTGEVWSWAGLLHLADPKVRFEFTDQPNTPPVP